MRIDERRAVVKIFRPFLKRPAEVVEEERHAVVRRFKLPEPKDEIIKS